jgi:hypothetical protein
MRLSGPGGTGCSPILPLGRREDRGARRPSRRWWGARHPPAGAFYWLAATRQESVSVDLLRGLAGYLPKRDGGCIELRTWGRVDSFVAYRITARDS